MSSQIKKNKVTLKKLIYVQNIFQKNLIMKTLEHEGIVVIGKSADLNSVLGYSMLGEELYVNEMDYERAFEVLQELEIQEDDFDELEKLAISYAVEDEEHNTSLSEQKHRDYVIKFFPLFAIVLVIAIIYKYSDPVIKWHDETLKWIVAQELNKNIEEKIRMSDVSKITELYLDAEEISDIKDLKYFSNLKVLELKTPKVDNLNPIKNLIQLDKLVLCGLNIKTLDSLNRMHLSDVTLRDLPLLSIAQLGHMEKLQKLELRGIPISSIQAITGAKSLEMMDLENMVIDDLEVLKDLPNLSSISIKKVKTFHAISLNELGRYQNVSLSGLDVEGRIDSPYMNTLRLENIDLGDKTDWINADRLKLLTLNYCQVTELAAFHDLIQLESLDLTGNTIQNIETLKNFTELKTLSLADNPITDLSPISTLKNIKILDLSGIDFKGQENFIFHLKLKELRLSNCNITEINFLENQRELKRLDLSENKIKNIEPLRMYRKELRHLDISENPVSDLSPLSEWFVADLERVEDGAELNISGISLGERGKRQLKRLNLKSLDVGNCGISDAEFIRSYENLQYLDISNNEIHYFESMFSLPYLREVNAKGNMSITETYLLFGIKTNWRREGAIRLSPGIYGCPVSWKNYYNKDERNTWFSIKID